MTPQDSTELFGIPGFEVSPQSVYFDKTGKRPYMMIEITRREKHYQCPCGKVSSIYYDGDYRQVRDLPFGEWDLYLVFSKYG